MAEGTTGSSQQQRQQPAPQQESRAASAPAKPLGTVDEDQAAYALARKEIRSKEKQEARARAEADPFKEGQERAQQRAERAAEANEVQKDDGGGLAANDIMAGTIAETINQPTGGIPRDTTRLARLMVRAAKAMQGHAGLATLLPPADTWGLVGQGDELHGHFVLIDLESLEKVVVTEHWVINEDRVFANAQQWPKALVYGDTLQKVG